MQRDRPPAPHWPALDGLRGLAVAAVLLYHHDAALMPGGFLGVSLFFTLSGFLITTLLLREHRADHTVRLTRFWARRARRLIPVSLAGLALALIVAALAGPSEALATTAGDVRAALLNVANWHFASATVTYGDTLNAPSPVTHYWSLAIEEQFYLCYPLVALVAMRRRWGLGAALAAVTAVSVALQLRSHDLNRAYLGTDTRAAELAIGGLAAILLASGWRPKHRLADGAGVVSLVALGVLWGSVGLGSTWLWRGGIVAHALLAAALVIGAIHGRVVSRLLALGPLLSLGRISYGVYVLHLPLFVLLTPERISVSGLPLLALRLAATLAAAALVHEVVEQPVRRGGAVPGWQGRMALVSGMSVVALLSVALPETTSSSVGDPDGAVIVTMKGADDEQALPVASSSTTTTATTVAPGAAPTVAPRPVPSTTVAPPPPRAPRLLVVGDSTAGANGAGMQEWAERTGRVTVDAISDYSCSFLSEGTVRIREGWEQEMNAPCVALFRTAVDLARQQGSDAIVIFIGSPQLCDWRLPGDDVFRGLGEPALDGRYAEEADADLRRLDALGIPILFADTPVPDWNPPSQAGGGPYPGEGPATMNDPGRTARLNEIHRTLIGSHQLVRSVPYVSLISDPDGTIDSKRRPDGLHLTRAAVGELMDNGFEDALRSAYQEVVTSSPSAAMRPNRWTP